MPTTARLTLRAFTPDDAVAFRQLAGDAAVARMTSDIPHPLTIEDAHAWLVPASGEVRFAVVEEGRLVGGTGYFQRDGGSAELGFWFGRSYWGQGFATEAASATLRHGFETKGFLAFSSSHFLDNPASQRVLQKLGFEVLGEGRIHSLARGEDVTAREYWLTRAKAEAILGRFPGRRRPRLLDSLLDRLLR